MTQQTKHTPAPWKNGKKWRDVYSQKGVLLAKIHAKVNEGVNVDEAKKNANLIAESPAMLEALKDLLNHHLHDSHGGEVSLELQNKLNKAHDSVARAEGRL